MESLLRNKILETIEKNSRIETGTLAKMLFISEADVVNEIFIMQKEHIINGYYTLIDWDKTSKEAVTAIIELKAIPKKEHGFTEIASQIAKFEEVDSVYLMSGGFDFLVIYKGKTMKEAAFFVAQKLATLDSITATATHFILEKYKDHGFVLDEDKGDDRPVVSF